MGKVIELTDRILDLVLILIFTAVFLIGGYITADSAYVFSNAGGGRIAAERRQGTEPQEILKELTEDAAAWLRLEGTAVDHPVMYGENNSKYLNLDPYGQYSLAGSVFLDCRNRRDFSDPYMVLYGHHMAHSRMFGALDAYEDPEYFSEHRRGTLTLTDGTEYALNLFAFSVADARDPRIFDPQCDPEGIHAYITETAKLFREPEGNPVIALTTCRDAGMTSRTVLFAEMTPV